MLRGLYRFYLYTVFIAMLLFAASGVEGLLQTVLAQTFFNTSLPQSTIVQSLVFTIISLFISALFGGLHYWLIRRDMRNDPEANNGAVRAFFLNAVEFIVLPLAVGIGGFTLASLGQQYTGNASFSTAFSITTLALWAIIEAERRRAPASAGAAIIFQRLHFYGTQLLLLFILTAIWLSGVGLLIDALIFGSRGSQQPVCGGFTVCPGPNLLSQMVAVLLVLLSWIGYGWLSRKDTMSLIRKVLHFFSLAYGVISLMVGIYRAASLLLFAILHIPFDSRSISGPYAQYDILSPLMLGLLVTGLYLYWLGKAARQPDEQKSVPLTAEAITTALLGASFWYGIGLLILNLLEQAAPSSTVLTPTSWANALALIITGIAYIPLDIHLRRRSKHAAFTTPLRGFVFALFGGGILTSAIGGATALYAYSTSLLGSPFDNWQYAAHSGLAALAVGIAIVGLYLWIGLREHFFSSPAKQPALATTTPPVSLATMPIMQPDQTPLTPTLTPSSPLATILDELLAGKMTRDEAITRIESLLPTKQPVE